MRTCIDKTCEGVLCEECKDLKPSMCGDRGLQLPKDVCNTIRFEGVEDTEINQGICIDLTEGVHAYDGDGSEIEYTVSPSEIGCCDVGEHEITYTAMGKGNKMLPSFCLGKPMLTTANCGLMTKVVTRLVTVLQALPPKILGIARTIIAPSTTFDPMDGVSGVDDNGNATEVTYEGRYDLSTGKQSIASFESDIEQPAKSLKVQLEPIQEGSGTPSPTNVRPISGRTSVDTIVSPTQSASDGTTYTTSLGQTVYGGVLDVVSGKLTVDMRYIVADGVNIKTSTGYGASGPNWLPAISLPSDAYGKGESATNIYANYLVASPSVQSTKDSIAFGNSNRLLVLHIGDMQGTDGTHGYNSATEVHNAVNSYLQSNPLTICYRIANPQTIQLTPQQVQLLLGTNNVWSDGDVEVIYSKPLEGATQLDIEGVYPITYHTEDSCGNETTETRYVIVANCDDDSQEPILCQGRLCCASLTCNYSSTVCEAGACYTLAACEQTEIIPSEA